MRTLALAVLFWGSVAAADTLYMDFGDQSYAGAKYTKEQCETIRHELEAKTPPDGPTFRCEP